MSAPGGVEAEDESGKKMAPWRRAEDLLEAARAERESERKAIAVARSGGIDPSLAHLEEEDEDGGDMGDGGGGGMGVGGLATTGAGATTGIALERRLDPATMTTRDIRAIIAQEGGPNASAGNLISGLQENVGKVLLDRRREHDRIGDNVRKLEKEIKDAEATLDELRRDCRELGADEYADRLERMEPGRLREVSARPVFHKRTDLEDKVSVLESEREATTRIRFEGERLKHMQLRVQEEVAEVRRRVNDLEEARKEERSLAEELERREIAAAEALGNARAMLRSMRRNVAKEKKLWMTEIKSRAEFMEQKKGFESFLKRQLDRHYALEEKARKKKEKKEREERERKTNASILAHKSLASKLNASLSGAASEEARYEAAFRKMGLRADKKSTPASLSTAAAKSIKSTSHSSSSSSSSTPYFDEGKKPITESTVRVQLAETDLDPDAVLEAVRQQEITRQELIKRRDKEQERVQELIDLLAEVRATLAEADAESKEPSMHRQRAAREAELSAAQKETDALRARVTSLRAAVDPVRLGLQTMAEKLLNLNPTLEDTGEIRMVFSGLQSKISAVSDTVRRLSARVESVLDELDQAREKVKQDASEKGPSSAASALLTGAMDQLVEVATSRVRGLTLEDEDEDDDDSVVPGDDTGLEVSAFNVRVPSETPRRVYMDSQEASRAEREWERRRDRELKEAAAMIRAHAPLISSRTRERREKAGEDGEDLPPGERSLDSYHRSLMGMGDSEDGEGKGSEREMDLMRKSRGSLPPTMPGPEGRVPVLPDVVPIIGDDEDDEGGGSSGRKGYDGGDVEEAPLVPIGPSGEALPYHPVNLSFKAGPPRLATTVDLATIRATRAARSPIRHTRRGSVSTLSSMESMEDTGSRGGGMGSESLPVLPTPSDVLGKSRERDTASSSGRHSRKSRMLSSRSGVTSFGRARAAVQRLRLIAAGDEHDAVFAREDIKTISSNIVQAQEKKDGGEKKRGRRRG